MRDRHAQRFTDPAEAAASRSVRAWGWALGEIELAPVTDRPTRVPPTRADIEAEIAAAEARRLRGNPERRADAAASILRWLIGDDVPVRGQNLGELVGGFGDVVRPPEQITDALGLAAHRRRRAIAASHDAEADPDSRQFARQDVDYLDGVVETLAWVLGKRPEAPITLTNPPEMTTRDLKLERVHAEDLIEQTKTPWAADGQPSARYGEGVKYTITWLLGDQITQPVDLAGQGPCSQWSEFPEMFRGAENGQRNL